MTHEEILTLLGDYVDYLIANSSAEAPMWNIEKVRSGKPNKWNYIDGCMITACLSLYKTTGDEKYLSHSFGNARIYQVRSTFFFPARSISVLPSFPALKALLLQISS